MRFTDERLDRVFGALAHPIRRKLIERLERGDATVGELARPFDVSVMAISKHLSTLGRAGLVERAVEGRFRRCQLRTEPLDEASAWLARHAGFWTSQFQSLARHLEEES